MDAVLRQALVGQTIQGSHSPGVRYVLAEPLGESQKGFLFRAQTEAKPSPTFVVTVHRPSVVGHEAIGRFREEAAQLSEALRLLATTSREISTLVDHGVHGVFYEGSHQGSAVLLGFLVREELSTQSLAKVIAAHGGFGVPVGRARRIAGHIARGLFALHEVGVVHRDLSPSNVILVQDSGQERAKLVDYGLGATLAVHAMEPSSIGYAPPERFGLSGGSNAPTSIGPSADVFSFAVILYELLSGSEAFARGDAARVAMSMVQGERPSLGRVRATLPAELRDKPELVAGLDREIGRATRPDPGGRHASIREFWAAIEPFLREVARPAASGAGVVVEDPVSFDGILPRSASSPDLSSRMTPPSTAMPASAAYSGPRPVAAPMPAWELGAAALASDKLSAGLLVEDGHALVALGSRGIYRLARSGWTLVPVPAGIDARSLRGLSRLPSGDFLLFGEAGFLGALSARGVFRKMACPERDVTWLGAYADPHATVLVGERMGERMSRPLGVVLLLPTEGPPVLFSSPGTSRLHAATRLMGGTLLVAGTQGALATLTEAGLVDVPWGRTGHLHALTRGPTGDAFAVGSGGHALRVTQMGGVVSATLEGVQTTRDLVAVSMDPETGAVWAAGGDGRLLQRRGDVWVRVPLPPTVTSTLVQVFPRASRVLVLADDGTVFSHLFGG